MSDRLSITPRSYAHESDMFGVNILGTQTKSKEFHTIYTLFCNLNQKFKRQCCCHRYPEKSIEGMFASAQLPATSAGTEAGRPYLVLPLGQWVTKDARTVPSIRLCLWYQIPNDHNFYYQHGWLSEHYYCQFVYATQLWRARPGKYAVYLWPRSVCYLWRVVMISEF